MSKKSDKELNFSAAYVTNGRHGTNAAISAGYAPKSAHVTASRLLKKAKVIAEIGRLDAKHTQAIEKRIEQKAFSTVGRLTELAQLEPKTTKGNIMGQVKACMGIAEINGEIIKQTADLTKHMPAEKRGPRLKELIEKVKQRSETVQ